MYIKEKIAWTKTYIPTIHSSVVDRGGSDWIFLLPMRIFNFFFFFNVRECKIKIKMDFLFSFHSFFFSF